MALHQVKSPEHGYSVPNCMYTTLNGALLMALVDLQWAVLASGYTPVGSITFRVTWRIHIELSRNCEFDYL